MRRAQPRRTLVRLEHAASFSFLLIFLFLPPFEPEIHSDLTKEKD